MRDVGTRVNRPCVDRDHLEPDPDARVLRVPRQPHPRRGAHAAALLGVDGTESAAEATASSLLHLHEREVAATPDDQVELVATRADVRPQDPVAAQAVVPECPPLASVHAAAGSGSVA